MNPTSVNGLRKRRELPGAAGLLAVVLCGLCLLLARPCFPANGGDGTPTFEDRAAAEKLSRSRYRDLEVTSLVIILVAGAGAILWAIRRRKP